MRASRYSGRTDALVSERNGEPSADEHRPDELAAVAPAPSDLAARVLWHQVQSSLLGASEPVMVGRFALRRCIGAGAMGELFAAFDEQLGREVAIKLVHPEQTRRGADQRLLREAKILARISHPNVVHVYQVGELDGRVFVAMELVVGRTLSEWLRTVDGARRKARIRAILSRFVAAGRGLDAAHSAGLAHRDFKPDNVLIGEDGRVRVVDFGLARALGGDADGDAAGVPDDRPDDHIDMAIRAPLSSSLNMTLTATGALLGTPRYMAPEQWQGERGDSRSDQFSFCVALYEALYGILPFAGETSLELAEAVVRGAFIPPPRGAGVPAAIRRALIRGLAREPEARFSTMGALLEILERALHRRRTAVAGLTVLATALVAALGIALVTPGDRTDHAATRLRMREAGAAERLAAVENRIAEFSAAGDPDEADKVFAAFATLPEHAETTALARGWLNQAERLGTRGDDEAETTAYANAYVHARHPPEQARALLGMARLFRRTRQWDRLGATLETLARDHAALSANAEVRALRIEEAVARRDFARALSELKRAEDAHGQGAKDNQTAGLAPEVVATIRQIARITATEHFIDSSVNIVNHVQRAPALDIDRDGRGEVVALRRGESHISVLGTGDPTLPVLARIDAPHGRPTALLGLSQVAGQQFTLISERPPWRTAYGPIDGDAAVAVHQWRTAATWTPAATVGELDGDGIPELYLGYHDQSPRFVAFSTVRNERASSQVGRTGEAYDEGTDRRVEQGKSGRDRAGRDWYEHAPAPAVDASNSWINQLTIADIDGDGRHELVMALGEWGAYDLRIMRPGDDGQLRLAARRKLGTINGLALLPAASGRGMWIAVVVTDRYPNRRVFPPDNPHGEPPGVYVLAWRAGGLDIIQRYPVPTAYLASPDLMSTGDFNGDGRADLAVSSGRDSPDTLLLLQTADGRFAQLTLRQLQVSMGVNVDTDPDHELLAVDVPRWGHPKALIPATRPLVVLGAAPPAEATGPDDSRDSQGRERGVLPVLDNPHLRPAEPPAGIDPALRRPWHRAEDLAAIGLGARAADILRRVAAIAEPATASMSLARAAELLVSAAHHERAAGLYEQAARDSAQPNDMRSRAIELYERVHRFADALRLTEQVLGDPALPANERARWRTRADSLRVHTEPAQILEFALDEPLDDTWQVEHPLALRREGKSLRVEAFNWVERVVARRPLWWSGGPLTIEAEIDYLGLDWGGGLSIALVPRGAGRGWYHPILTGAASGGGGGVYTRHIQCWFGETNNRQPHPHVALEADEQRHTLRLEVIPDQHRLWCAARTGDFEYSAPIAFDADDFSPGWYDLVLMSQLNALDGSPIRASARIHKLRLTGVADHPPGQPQPLPRPEDARTALYRALSNGAFTRALAMLDDRPAGISDHQRQILRHVALSELNRRDEAEAALRQALAIRSADGRAARCAGPAGEEWLLRQLLQLRPALLGPLLRRMCQPGGYYRELWLTWKHMLHQRPDDPGLYRVVTTQLGDIDTYEPDGNDGLPVIRLLRARARAWAANGSLAAARADLQRALTIGEKLTSHAQRASRPDRAQWRSTMRQELAECHRELAQVLLAAGDRDAAMDEIRSALKQSLTPAIQADTIATRPGLRDLHDHPDWSATVTATRIGQTLTQRTARPEDRPAGRPPRK